MAQNLPVMATLPGLIVSAILTEAETVAGATTPKNVDLPIPRHLKERALEHLPAERTADDQPEVPGPHPNTTLTIDHETEGATARIGIGDRDLPEPTNRPGRAIGSEGPFDLFAGQAVFPVPLTSVETVPIAHSAQPGWGAPRPPDTGDAAGVAATGGVVVDGGNSTCRIVENFAGRSGDGPGGRT